VIEGDCVRTVSRGRSVCRTGRELCYFRWKGGREEDIGAISYEPLLNEKYQARYETLEILLFSIQIP